MPKASGGRSTDLAEAGLPTLFAKLAARGLAWREAAKAASPIWADEGAEGRLLSVSPRLIARLAAE